MIRLVILAAALLQFFCGCSGIYYSAMEKIGIPKRDILVDRVESAGDAQIRAQKKFKSALEQFESVVQVPETELRRTYENLESAYSESRKAAENVSDRIDRVESVAGALFEEWEEELGLYENPELRRISRKKLEATKTEYRQMITSMHRAEQSMQPVLEKFEDNVLFLKHNLNAQAIAALGPEFSALREDIGELIEDMNLAIESSNRFVVELRD